MSTEYAPDPGRRRVGYQSGYVPFPAGSPLLTPDPQRFPKGFDLVENGYIAGMVMADGRIWTLMPLALARLRIVIVEDMWTAGEHWCYGDPFAALVSWNLGPDTPPTGWTRHMRPDGVFEWPRDDGTVRVEGEYP